MAPLTLEGHTLGQRQRHFNKLVNDALAKKVTFDDIKFKEEKSDVDILFKIDIASKYRIVDYILEILKSNDLLHVSRAIKQSTWLITDRQYAHIVNPEHLNEVLFHEMTAKASCKFLLQVRLKLKDEDRVEQFYKYYESKDLSDIALKWLPNCSLEFIKDVVAKKPESIDKDLFKRLCERTVSVLELFVEKNDFYRNREYAKAVIFLINTDTEKYLNVVEKLADFHRFRFGPKHTELILKKCPERIMDNFEKYAFTIDAGVLGKHLGKAKAQEFLLKHVKNEKISSWFTYDTIAKFVGEMPKDEKFALIKQVFIDKTAGKSNDDSSPMPYLRESLCVKMSACYSAGSAPKTSNKNIYQWYKHAPFSVAFPELKKLIRAESSPDERIAMMSVMLLAAGSNMKNVEAVLQYYHDRHINEPFKFKVQFVDHLLATTNTHRFEEKSWKLLEELFHSMEVYLETDNRVINCVNSIILYKVLHDESVPEVIEKKFEFDCFEKAVNKLNQVEKDKMFKYLYNYIEQILNKQEITNRDEYDTAIKLLEDYFDLLLRWDKELFDYPVLLQKVKEIISIKKNKSWSVYTAALFDKKKSWRRHLFEESLLLSPSEIACLNALKHDPDLLKRYSSETDAVRYSDSVSLKKLHSKLRVYWPQSLGSEWASAYRARLQQTGGHKAVVRALCALLPPQDLLQIIKKYAPKDHKIIWSEADELELSLQKNIAKSMHTARPQPPPAAVLWYAKGDYLQFALPSLSAILCNLSEARCREHLPTLLDAPVSVQKHGLRLVCSKLTSQEIKETLSKTWYSSKNSSIRAIIFQLAHELLSREKSPSKAEDVWQLLEMFIDNLSQEENKIIYTLMGDVSSTPMNIRPKYLMKSYKFLKALPAKFECKDLVDNLACYTAEVMDKIDPDFVKDIILEHIEQFYVQKKYQKRTYNSYNNVIASYLIWGKTEEAQLQRYESIFVPILNFVFPRWNEVRENQYMVRTVFNELLDSLNQIYTQNVLKQEIEVPVKLFKSILNKMEESLAFAKNYMIMRVWQFKVAFVHCSAEARTKLDLTECLKPTKDGDKCCGGQENEQWIKLCTNLIPAFGAQCIRYLKEDVATSPILYTSFEEALSTMLHSVSFDQQLHNALYEIFLADPGFIYGYLVVLRLMPTYCYNDADKESLAKYLKIIKAHPSLVVQMQFDIKFSDSPEYNAS